MTLKGGSQVLHLLQQGMGQPQGPHKAFGAAEIPVQYLISTDLLASLLEIKQYCSCRQISGRYLGSGKGNQTKCRQIYSVGFRRHMRCKEHGFTSLPYLFLFQELSKKTDVQMTNQSNRNDCCNLKTRQGHSDAVFQLLLHQMLVQTNRTTLRKKKQDKPYPHLSSSSLPPSHQDSMAGRPPGCPEPHLGSDWTFHLKPWSFSISAEWTFIRSHTSILYFLLTTEKLQESPLGKPFFNKSFPVSPY